LTWVSEAIVVMVTQLMSGPDRSHWPKVQRTALPGRLMAKREPIAITAAPSAHGGPKSPPQPAPAVAVSSERPVARIPSKIKTAVTNPLAPITTKADEKPQAS
jgi:hypothetical protein